MKAATQEATQCIESQDEAGPEGWAWPLLTLKPHYFVDGMSLCGRHRFGYPDLLVPGRGRGELDCSECQRRLKKRGQPAQDETPEVVH